MGKTALKNEDYKEQFLRLLEFINDRRKKEPDLLKNGDIKSITQYTDFTDSEGRTLGHLAVLIYAPKLLTKDSDEYKQLQQILKVTNPFYISSKHPMPIQLLLELGCEEIFKEIFLSKESDFTIGRYPVNSKISLLARKSLTGKAREIYDSLVRKFILMPALQILSNNSAVLPFFPENDLLKKSYLNYAAEIGDSDFILGFIKSYGKDFEQHLLFTSLKINPLISAIENHQHDILKLLLLYFIVDDDKEVKQYPLHVAAKMGDLKSIELLLNFNLSQSNIKLITVKNFKERNSKLDEFKEQSKVNDVLIIQSLEPKGLIAFRRSPNGLEKLILPSSNMKEGIENFSQEQLRAWLKKNVVNSGRWANINVQNEFGQTPLYIALVAGHFEVALALLENGADPHIQTFTGETIFHAIASLPLEQQQAIKKQVKIENFENKTNIYGQTPEQFIKYQLSISQDNIIEKIVIFHKFYYLDNEYISKNGYCNGFTFLFQYFRSRGKSEIFFALLKCLAEWDPVSGKDLKEKEPPKELAPYFNNTFEIFNYFINWLTWFQHNPNLSKDTFLSQSDRQHQFYEGEVKYLFKDLIYDSVSEKEFLELQKIFENFPLNVCIDCGGTGHIVSYSLIRDDETSSNCFSYYDSNLNAHAEFKINAGQLTRIIVDVKYKMLYGRGNISRNCVSIYYFPWSNVDFKGYYYFDNSTLKRKFPQNLTEYAAFKASSEHRFSPLHVAALAHSHNDVNALLSNFKKKVNEKDSHGMTAFDIAIRSNDLVFCQLFLKCDDLQLENSQAIVEAYRLGFFELVREIIKDPRAKNLNDLFQLAILKEDLEMVQLLVEQKKIDSAEIISGYLTPSIFLCLSRKDQPFTDELFKRWSEGVAEEGDVIIFKEKSSPVYVERIKHSKQEHELISTALDLISEEGLTIKHLQFYFYWNNFLNKNSGRYAGYQIRIVDDIGELGIKLALKPIQVYLQKISQDFDRQKIVLELAEKRKFIALFKLIKQGELASNNNTFFAAFSVEKSNEILKSLLRNRVAVDPGNPEFNSYFSALNYFFNLAKKQLSLDFDQTFDLFEIFLEAKSISLAEFDEFLGTVTLDHMLAQCKSDDVEAFKKIITCCSRKNNVLIYFEKVIVHFKSLLNTYLEDDLTILSLFLNEADEEEIISKIDILIRNGAEIDIPNASGKTPYGIAQENNLVAILEYFDNIIKQKESNKLTY